MHTQQLNAPASRSRAALAQTSPPEIVRFVARDDDNADEVLSVGDVLEIGFDRAARPPAQLCRRWLLGLPAAASGGCADSGDRGFVDALFEFSQPIGSASSPNSDPTPNPIPIPSPSPSPKPYPNQETPESGVYVRDLTSYVVKTVR